MDSGHNFYMGTQNGMNNKNGLLINALEFKIMAPRVLPYREAMNL